MRERSKLIEADLFGNSGGAGIQDAAGFWINQVDADGQTIINAARSLRQGVKLTGLTLFRFDSNLRFKERVEAASAELEPGQWVFRGVKRYRMTLPPVAQDDVATTPEDTPVAEPAPMEKFIETMRRGAAAPAVRVR